MTTAKETGKCPHGEFDLLEGCPICSAENLEKYKVMAEEAETALALRPGEDLEVRSFYNEALKLQEYAVGRVIATVDDSKLATNDLIIISKLRKAMEGKRKGYLEPLKVQADAIRDTYNFLMAPVLDADKITCDKLMSYQNEQARIRKEQEDINRLMEEAAQKQKELNGEIVEVEKVEVLPDVGTKVSTDMGIAGQRANWKWEVVDFSLVPREYLVVDDAQLTAIARGHHDTKPIPGVRFYNEPIIARRAR